MPDNPFPAEDRLEVQVGKTPYARFDLNDYSVPPDRVRRTLVVVASLETVRVLDGLDVVATHARSFDKGAQIEDPAHLQTLVDYKRAARGHRDLDRLQQSAPSIQELFRRAAARHVHLGTLTRGLTALLDAHGAADLEAAVTAALAQDAAHLGAVRHFIDQHRHARGQKPPIAVPLPPDPRLQLTVRPHSLRDYERLSRKPDDPSPDA